MEDDLKFLDNIVRRLWSEDTFHEWNVGIIHNTEPYNGIIASRFNGDYTIRLAIGNRMIWYESPKDANSCWFESEDDAVQKITNYGNKLNERISERTQYHAVCFRQDMYSSIIGLYSDYDEARQRLLEEVDESRYERLSEANWMTPDRESGYYIESTEVLG